MAKFKQGVDDRGTCDDGYFWVTTENARYPAWHSAWRNAVSVIARSVAANRTKLNASVAPAGIVLFRREDCRGAGLWHDWGLSPRSFANQSIVVRRTLLNIWRQRNRLIWRRTGPSPRIPATFGHPMCIGAGPVGEIQQVNHIRSPQGCMHRTITGHAVFKWWTNRAPCSLNSAALIHIPDTLGFNAVCHSALVTVQGGNHFPRLAVLTESPTLFFLRMWSIQLCGVPFHWVH